MRRPLEAAVVAAVAWLLLVRAHAPAHLDTARDLLLARDAAEGLARRLAGPPSSFASLAQGALWIHVLEVARRAGVGVSVLEQSVRASLALATAGVYAMARARAGTMGRRGVLATTAAHAVAAPLLVGFPVLWNPSLAALAAVAFWAALRSNARRASAATVGGAAVALAILVDLHVVAVLLVPVLLAMAFAGRRAIEGGVVAAASAGLGGAILWASSRDAVLQNAHVLGQHPVLASLGVLAVASLTTALAVRARHPRSPDRVTYEAAATFAAVLLAGSMASGQPASARYWVPVAPAACLGLGCLLERLRGRWALGAGVALGSVLAGSALDLVVPSTDPMRTWRLADTERCAATLAARGWTAHGARRSLDAPGGRTFVSSLTAFLPLGSPADAPARLLVRPAGGTCADVATPVVDVARGQRCIGTACLALTPAVDDATRMDTGFAALAYPDRWALAPAPPPGPHRVWYVLPTPRGTRAIPAVALGDPPTSWTVDRRDNVFTVTADVDRPWQDDGWPPVLLPASLQ